MTPDDSALALVAWSSLAFGFWLMFAHVSRRLRLPAGALVAAMLSWIVAGLCVWALASVVDRIGLGS
jgi:hypothetical protein